MKPVVRQKIVAWMFVFPFVFLFLWLLSELIGAGLGAMLDAISSDWLEAFLTVLYAPWIDR